METCLTNTYLQKSSRNFIAGITYQFIVLLCSYILRIFFIRKLGIDYLGVNGLFSNILSILSIADLGIGSAMMYSLYKPLSEGNEQKIAALILYYKKINRIIALVFFLVGVALIPFLKYIIVLDKPFDHIEIYYLLVLSNTVISYLLYYKTIIVSADQKDYLLKIYNLIFVIAKFAVQILILIFTHSYILYLAVQILATLSNNLFSVKKAEKLYPYIKQNTIKISGDEKKELFANVKSLFLYRIGGVIVNNTDNIIISILVGTIYVGYYTNYYMIIIAIGGFCSVILTSVQASVGNLAVNGTKEDQLKVFKILNLLYFWVYAFCAICFLILLQDFILIWLGSGFLLDRITVAILIFNFYSSGMLSPFIIFREATALFRETKYIILVTALCNIVFSVILGRQFGIAGVLGATALAKLLTNFWFEPYALYVFHFKMSANRYYLTQILKFVLLAAVAALTYFTSTLFTTDNILISLVLKLSICLIIPNAVFFLLFRRTQEFAYLLGAVKDRLKRR